MQQKSPGFQAAKLLLSLIPIVISAGVMAIGVRLGLLQFVNHISAVGLNATTHVFSGLLIGIIIYVAMLYLFRVGEVRKLLSR